MDNILRSNAKTLKDEINWLDRLFSVRNSWLKNTSNLINSPDRDDIKGVHPPELWQGSSHYGDFVIENNLKFEDRLLLIMGLVGILDVNFYARQTFRFIPLHPDFCLLPHGGRANILASGLTYLTLLAGDNIEGRLKAIDYLNHKSVLVKNNIIAIQAKKNSAVYLDGSILVDENHISYLLTGNWHKTFINEGGQNIDMVLERIMDDWKGV